MRELKERQKKILQCLVDEYIKTAQPVSSFDLLERYRLNVCSATIRNDMLVLTKEKLLYKPYSSAGRIPTTKGYKVYLQEVSKNFSKKTKPKIKINITQKEDLKTSLSKIFKEITRITRNLVIGYLKKEDFLLEEGWKEILLEPELKNDLYLKRFLEVVSFIEERIDLIERKINSDFEVFIGKENPFYRYDDFTLICCKPQTRNEKIVFTLLGPKRMAYKKNISLMSGLLNEFNKLNV